MYFTICKGTCRCALKKMVRSHSHWMIALNEVEDKGKGLNNREIRKNDSMCLLLWENCDLFYCCFKYSCEPLIILD